MVLSAVLSQQEGPGVNSRPGSFCLHVLLCLNGFSQLSQLSCSPKSKDMDFWLIWVTCQKLPTCVIVSVCVCLSLCVVPVMKW